MSKFHPGDHVRIRQWDDMEAEFGLLRNGNINCKHIFIPGMKTLCGKEATLAAIDPNGLNARFVEADPALRLYLISEDMLEFADETTFIDFEFTDNDFTSIMGGIIT